MRRYRRHLQALFATIETIGGAEDSAPLLGHLMSQVTDALDADRATLYFIDPDTGELWSRVATGDSTLEIRLKLGQGLAGWVGLTGAPLIINDVLKDDRFDARWDKKSGYRTNKMIAVPVLGPRRTVLGVLQVLNKRRGDFDSDDQRLLEAIATLCAIRTENLTLKGSLGIDRASE